MSIDKSLRGVSCVECRFCFFDESLESSFSDSEVGIFFFNFLENQIKSHSEVVGRVHVSCEPGVACRSCTSYLVSLPIFRVEFLLL